MLILTEQDLKSLLKMSDVIGAVEYGFRALAAGATRIPNRLGLSLPEDRATVLMMPAYAEPISNAADPKLGAKIVSVFPANAERGLDVVQALYLLLDGETGAPLSVMDGRLITGIRTAAASAAATRYMSNPGKKVLAVFGAGVQAAFHIEAMRETAEINRILIASRGTGRAERLRSSVRDRFGIECELVSHNEAAASADLICTCSSASEPLFDGSLLKPGTHINAVGAFTPTARELDTATMTRSRVIIDAEGAAGSEAGEILIPASQGIRGFVKGTLADVITGTIQGRRSPEEITVFKSCGLAIEDLVTARLAYDLALDAGIGIEVPM